MSFEGLVSSLFSRVVSVTMPFGRVGATGSILWHDHGHTGEVLPNVRDSSPHVPECRLPVSGATGPLTTTAIVEPRPYNVSRANYRLPKSATDTFYSALTQKIRINLYP